MKIEEKFVETKFGKICYLEAGEGDKIVVFLHGWFGWPVMIKRFARKFGIENYKIIAPYLPGHGLSFPLPREYLFKDLVETMDEFFKSLGIKKSDLLIGHSMGGAIAWELAMADHDTKKLVIMDAFLNYSGRSITNIIWRVIKDKFNEFIEMSRHKNSMIQEELGVGVRKPQLISPVRFWKIVKSAKITKQTLIKNIPVLALWGKNDNVVPMTDYTPILDQAGVKIITFSGGHYWFAWQEYKMLEEIDNFINL